MSGFTESVVEEAVLEWLQSVGWQVAHGPDLAPDTPGTERADFGEVVLTARLRAALTRLNADLPAEALDDAFRKLTRIEAAELVQRNRATHRLLVDGVNVEYRDANGAIRGAQARVIDFDDPANNNWLAVNQFSVVEHKHSRRPDIVLFVNGLALAVLELKNAASENATIWSAYHQIQTYKAKIPSLFASTALLVISDGVEARVGMLTAGREWFKPWRTISGEALADAHLPELQVVTEGLLVPSRFLDLLRDFIVFEDDGSGRITKKMAGYHQFHAVQAAVHETLRAAELARMPQVAELRATYEVGASWPGDRQRFTLAHEIGHLALDSRLAPALDKEKAADRFAGAFLVPAPKVKECLGERRKSLEVYELYILKHEFGLSICAWTYRALHVGVITRQAHQQLWRHLVKQRWHIHEPGDQYPPEEPRLFEQNVYPALAEDYISESKAAELLGLSLVQLAARRRMKLENADGGAAHGDHCE